MNHKRLFSVNKGIRPRAKQLNHKRRGADAT